MNFSNYGRLVIPLSLAYLAIFLAMQLAAGMGPGAVHVDEATYLLSELPEVSLGGFPGLGYYFLADAFNQSLFLLITLNIILYVVTNKIIFSFISGYQLGNVSKILLLIILLDPYRAHLALHVLKETAVIFGVVSMLLVGKRAYLGAFVSLWYRIAAPIYFLVLVKWTKRNLAVLVFLAIVLVSIIYLIAPEFVLYIIRGEQADMVFQSYDRMPTFNDLGFYGDIIRTLTWPIFLLSGGFFILSPAIMFAPIFVSIVVLQIWSFIEFKRPAITLGVYGALAIFAFLTPGFTTYVRYAYPLVVLLPILMIKLHSKKNECQPSMSIIGSVGVPANYGGWETLVQHLCFQLKGRCDLKVYCSSLRYEQKQSHFNGAKLHYIPLDANGISSIPYDLLSMLHASKYKGSQLVLGVSGSLFLPIVKLFSKNRFIVNIDGLEWRREKWGTFAKWYLKLSEKIAVRFADAVVTDNAVLQQYVKQTYNRESTLIAYGGDHVSYQPLSKSTLEQYPFLDTPYAFKVARIEPENNIDMILEAFIQDVSMPLVLVGNWDSSKYGEEIRHRFNGVANLYLLDAIYDQQVLDQMRSNATMYIHGHSAGGTNPSLVEAMNLSLPILAYDVDFNKETTKYTGYYFSNASSLRDLINNLSEESRLECGQRMKVIATNEYTWAIVAKRYLDLVSNT